MVKKEENFEEKLRKLENIVKELENGDVNLDDAINKFNEAMKLSKDCSERLKKVEAQVNKILTEDGKLEEYKMEE